MLRKVEKPSRYIGGEWNEIVKNPSEVKTKVALIFPDTYEIGMSHLGLRILYSLLNQRKNILAERVFAPWIDFEIELRKKGLPLFSLENQMPLREFNILGFSLLYELNYSNVLNILNLGQIPLRSSHRDLSYPLIIAGGPAAFNPEPLSEFIDLFFIGDGEEGFLEIIDRFQSLKEEVKDKTELLKYLSEINGTYIPSFYQPYHPKNSFLIAVKPKNSFPKKIKKRIINDLNKHPFPEKIIVPYTEIVFDRVSVEISRGCPQRCRFCQAASIYLPYRIRSPENVIKCTINSLEQTGFEDVSLATLSPTDYPYLEKTVKFLMDNLSSKKIALGLSALRPSGLSKDIIENIKRVRKTGFTIAPEAGTERLRRVINKNLKEEEILFAIEKAFSLGWRLLKLYFMIGLPTEKEEDLRGIVKLVEKISYLGKKIIRSYPKIHLSLTSFIPKPHTPFQWLPMEKEEVLKEKFVFIKKKLKKYPWVRFKDHSIKMSIVEAIFSRGDRRLNNILESAWEKGARFDSWKDKFNNQIWMEAFSKGGVDPKIYLSSLSEKSILPWDHIETGFSKIYLLSEMKKGLQGKETPSCLKNKCGICRGCDFWTELRKTFHDKIELSSEKEIEYIGKKGKEALFYRCEYTKLRRAKFLSHLDLTRVIERAFRRARIPIRFSGGFHPKMLISYCPALPLGIEGKKEILEFSSFYILDEKEFLDRINRFLPEDIQFLSLKKIVFHEKKLSNAIKGFCYSFKIEEEEVKKAIKTIREKMNWRDLNDIEIHKKIIQKIESENELVEKISLNNDKIYFHIKFNPQKPLKIQNLIGKYYLLENPVFFIMREKILI